MYRLWSKLNAYKNGRLSADLKRGVLSEDAVDDVLTKEREMMVRIKEIVTVNGEK